MAKGAKKERAGVRVVEAELPVFVIDLAKGEAKSLYETQGIKEKLAGWVARQDRLDPDKVADGVSKVLNSCAYILNKVSDAAAKAGGGFKLDSIELGVAVDANGSVGFATLGVEASLKFAWKR